MSFRYKQGDILYVKPLKKLGVYEKGNRYETGKFRDKINKRVQYLVNLFGGGKYWADESEVVIAKRTSKGYYITKNGKRRYLVKKGDELVLEG